MNFKLRFAFLLFPLLVCIALNGCSEPEKIAARPPVVRKTPKKAPVAMPAPAPLADEEKADTLSNTTTDVRIELEISNLWLRSNANSYNDLTVNCRNGDVVLAGSVPDAALRSKAEQLSRQVEGVQKITNRIVISQKTSDISASFAVAV